MREREKADINFQMYVSFRLTFNVLIWLLITNQQDRNAMDRMEVYIDIVPTDKLCKE